MTMFILALLTALTSAAAEDPLRAVLKSPRESLKLYSNFKSSHHLAYTTGAENSMRFRLFLESAHHVADYNEDNEDTGHYAINKFSVMSEEERHAYQGLNMTNLDLEQEAEEDSRGEEDSNDIELTKRISLPYQVLWTNSGSVTEVQDQGSCGSCWAFAAVASIETFYKQKSGVLRRFSEQEFLDCTKAEDSDGCKGALASAPFQWSVRNGGRLAAARDRKYEKKDRECRASTTPDGMIAYKIESLGYIGKSENAYLQGLQDGALAANLVATDKFFQYDNSIMRDTSCADSDRTNHIIAVVGYSTSYLLIKNSWGTDWGEEGFARLARNHDNCKLFSGAYYPRFKSTGVADSGSDPATDYRAPAEQKPSCQDLMGFMRCATYKKLGCCGPCDSFPDPMNGIRATIMRKFCAKSCGHCGDANCPGEKIECLDGVCRDEHMCTYSS